MSRYPVSRIQGILRMKENNPAVGPLRPARSTDATVIQAIAQRIASDQLSSKQLLLITGFGLDKNLNVPLRLPALAIPGLQLMERMNDAGLPVPPYLLYQATDFIAETNGMDQQSARACATVIQEYLERYIRAFHPSVAEHVHIKFGCEYSGKVRDDVTSIVEDIRRRALENSTISQAIEQLKASEKRHSNEANKHDAYAAANVVYNGASGRYPFEEEIPRNIDTILPIGGKAEEPFFALTSDFADRRAGTQVIPMVTPLGAKPTYYLYPELGDPKTVEEFRRATVNTRLNGPIRGDLAALLSDAGSADAVADIFPHHS